MQCDFQNVTDILINNMGSSVTMYYNNLLNILFGSYLAETSVYEFDRPIATKLHKGIIRVAPEMSEFYLNADRSVLCKDIKELLQYIFDKPNTYKEIYQLIKYDETLSVEYRKQICSSCKPTYTDDTALTTSFMKRYILLLLANTQRAITAILPCPIPILLHL